VRAALADAGARAAVPAREIVAGKGQQ